MYNKSGCLRSCRMWSDVSRQCKGLSLNNRNIQEEFLGVLAKVQAGYTRNKVKYISVSLLGAM